MSLIAEADFGLSLLREISVNQTTVLSPISLALALSLVHLGAKGTSNEQIKNTLCGGTNHDDCVSHFTALQKSLSQKDHPYLKNWMYCNKRGNISCVPEDERSSYDEREVPADFPLQDTDVLMNIANRIFASNEISVKKAYKEQLASKFNSTLQNIDYCEPDRAAEIVNSFVKNETAGKIDNLVGPGSFADGKAALLVNAVYFHGRWLKTFDEENNERMNFYFRRGLAKKKMFMKHSNEVFPLHRTRNFNAISLPYGDQRYRLTIVVPNKRFGLAEALANTTGEELQQLLSNEENETVNLSIPKFKIRVEIQLQDILQKMGITDPFTDKADLSGITDSGMHLGNVNHRVNFDVNEKGTTAAASSAIEMDFTRGKIVEAHLNLVVDQPFLFVLSFERHILFIGQYYG